MSSTNSTSHYNLPQFIGTDKPAWLTDVNGAMSAIDAGIYEAKTKADTADTNAGLADTKAGNAQETANTALTNAGTAQTTADGNTTKIGTLASLDTSAKTDLVSAINEVKGGVTTNTSAIAEANNAIDYVEGQMQMFNLTDFRTLTLTSSNNNITVGSSTLRSAVNSDGSIGKFYGYVSLDNNTGTNITNVTFTTSDTGLRPTTAITIDGVIGGLYKASSSEIYMNNTAITIGTNGKITFTFGLKPNSYRHITISPCLLFMKDFGDIPVTPVG